MRSMDEWFKKGDEVSFVIHHGVLNEQSLGVFEQLKKLMNDNIPLQISNSSGLQICIKSVKIKTKEHDFEYNLEICDIVVNGEIL